MTTETESPETTAPLPKDLETPSIRTGTAGRSPVMEAIRVEKAGDLVEGLDDPRAGAVPDPDPGVPSKEAPQACALVSQQHRRYPMANYRPL